MRLIVLVLLVVFSSGCWIAAPIINFGTIRIEPGLWNRYEYVPGETPLDKPKTVKELLGGKR